MVIIMFSYLYTFGALDIYVEWDKQKNASSFGDVEYGAHSSKL